MTSGGNVKVVFEGEHYLKNENAQEIYQAAQEVRSNPTEENRDRLTRLLNPHHREVVEGPLEQDGLGNMYLEGYSQPLSSEMGELLHTHLDQGLDIDPFVNFWQRLQLNPNTKARQDFLEYIQDFGITITDEGYALLYKAVNRNENADLDARLVEYVGQEYLKHQITSDNPDPSDVFVVEDGQGYALVNQDDIQDQPDPPENIQEVLEQANDEGIISFDGSFARREYRIEYLGDIHYVVNMDDTPMDEIQNELVEAHSTDIEYLERLDDLYADIANSHDAPFEPSSVAKRQDGTHGMEIELGETQDMPRHLCDPDSSVSCSKGLHVGSHKYVDSFGSDMDVILAVAVNPRDIVALPDYDHSKIRTCRYLPYAVMEREDDGSWEEVESAQVQTDQLNEDFDYEGELETLEEKDGLTDLEEDRKEILENRVQTVS
jgi:hypothetical protein